MTGWEACMTTHTIHSDRPFVSIKGSNGTWIIAEDASVTTHGGAAILEEDGLHGNRIVIDGDVTSSAPQSVGAWFMGNRTDVTVGKQSEIVGDNGVLLFGKGGSLVNHGEIHSGAAAISSEHAAHIVNGGQLTAYVNIVVASGSTITNTGDGEIVAGDTGISIEGDKASKIVNGGLLTGNIAAVQDGDGALTLVNHGRIYGNVNLGRGDDVLDIRDGFFQGDIDGGEGNDTFLVSSSQLTITEGLGEGVDTVKSSVSYTLADNLDDLTLMGKANIHGMGNGLANFLTGNAGDNKLSGADGSDILNGKKGDDLLVGGAGGDNFVFRKGNDVDTVRDYTDGEDKIAILGFAGIASFAELQPHIHQHDAHDVWIALGHGDRLVLHNTAAADLDMGDFSFGGP
jgi:Ca2+-binding RTX toxin-like protein